jgi:hypothetical protein
MWAVNLRKSSSEQQLTESKPSDLTITGRGIKTAQAAVACVRRVGVASEASKLPRKPGKDHRHLESPSLVAAPLKIGKGKLSLA